MQGFEYAGASCDSGASAPSEPSCSSADSSLSADAEAAPSAPSAMDGAQSADAERSSTSGRSSALGSVSLQMSRSLMRGSCRELRSGGLEPPHVRSHGRIAACASVMRSVYGNLPGVGVFGCGACARVACESSMRGGGAHDRCNEARGACASGRCGHVGACGARRPYAHGGYRGCGVRRGSTGSARCVAGRPRLSTGRGRPLGRWWRFSARSRIRPGARARDAIG